MNHPKYCIGVGFPKCGTTSLFHLLAESGNFNIYEAKESTFLNKEDFSLDGYDSIFKQSINPWPDMPLLPYMEITPHYVYNDTFYENIKCISKKFLFTFLVVRNPILRSISHYVHDLRLGFCPVSPDVFLDPQYKDLTYYVHSRLGHYLERYLSAEIGKVYVLELLKENNAWDLKNDIYQAFFASYVEHTEFIQSFKKDMPSNNGAGFVPYVTYYPEACKVVADGKSISLPAKSYLIERVLVPYGYQTEIVTDFNERRKTGLDRLRYLSGKALTFKKEDIQRVLSKVFIEDLDVLEKNGIQFPPVEDVTYECVESRLTMI